MIKATVVLLLAFAALGAYAADHCNPTPYIGKKNLCFPAGQYCGECVSFVKICTGDYRTTKQWIPGAKVRGNHSIAPGTAIATFPGGKYYGHTAIYMGQTAAGLEVVDQNWPPVYAVQRHVISWNWHLSNDWHVIQ